MTMPHYQRQGFGRLLIDFSKPSSVVKLFHIFYPDYALLLAFLCLTLAASFTTAKR